MAITAAITLGSATGTAPAATTATCTVTNNNAADANVLGIYPKITPTGATQQSVGAQAGTANLGPGQTVRVAASGGTLAISFPIICFAPFPSTTTAAPSPANPSSYVYDIGADVYTSATGADALVAASTTTFTVSAPTH